MVSNNKEKYKVWRHGDPETRHTVIETYSETMAAEKFADKDRGRVKDYEDSGVTVYVITPDEKRYVFEVERVMYMAASEISGPDDVES